jgi:hypothetical protein
MAGNGYIAEIDIKKFTQIIGGSYLSIVNNN